MGANCSCYEENPNKEMMISKYKESRRSQTEIKTDSNDKIEYIVVEFKALAGTNPVLAQNLTFQSLAKGYLARTAATIKNSNKRLSFLIQRVAKGYLARKSFQSAIKGKLFGLYKILPGTIKEKTIMSIRIFEKTLEKYSKNIDNLNSETLVLLKKGVYYQGN